MSTEEYHQTLLKYRCRYTERNDGRIGWFIEAYGSFITAESKEEAEDILRKLRPKALKVWVYDGEQVYAHKEKTTVEGEK